MRFLALFLAFWPTVLAAKVCQDSVPVHRIPRLTLKTNVGAPLFVFKQSWAVAADLRIAPRVSVQAGGGSFFYSGTFAAREGESYKGLRLRYGIRYFASLSAKSAFYIGLEAKYHNIRHRRYRDVFRQGQQYIEYLLTDRRIRTHAVGWCIGVQTYNGSGKRLLIEPFAGFGLGFHTVRHKLPADGEEIGGNTLFEFSNGKSSLPELFFGLHMGYVIW